MINQFNTNVSFELTENQIHELINKDFKTVRKNISLNKLQKKIQTGLNSPEYHRIYLRYIKLKEKKKATYDELNEIINLITKMRSYEMSILYNELTLIF